MCPYYNVPCDCDSSPLKFYNYWLPRLLSHLIDIITIILLTSVWAPNSQSMPPKCWRLLIQAQQGSNQAAVLSGLVSTPLTTVSQRKQHSAHRSEQSVSERQTTTAARTGVSCITSDNNPTQHLQHEPLLTHISNAEQMIVWHIT